MLVADFLDPTGVDVRDITHGLAEQMRTTLADHPNIRIERLHRPIRRTEGSERAREIAEDPAVNAAIVIWGNYVSPPDPEVTVHFEIVKQRQTYLGEGREDQFGPSIIQPDLFSFKADLGSELGQLVSFSAALVLFNDSEHLAAVPLFDTAANDPGNADAGETRLVDFERPLRFYRGTNFAYLGRALEALPDLEAVLPLT